MQLISGFLLFFIGLNACSGQGASPRPLIPEEAKTRIDSLFAAFDRKDSPGYAIGISQGADVLYTAGYGSANLDYEVPITPRSVFDIASVSKQFTAACIALLVLDGQIDLEMPVSRFVPALAKYRDTVRIKHLIYNTSGIIDYYKLPRPDRHSWITFQYFDIDYCIGVALSPDTLAFRPGAQWDYCNVNYMLLTKIVEAVSGQSFSSFARERLFLPLGMTHTLVNDDVTMIIKDRVTPYNPRTEEYIAAYKQLGIAIGSEGRWLQHPRNSPHYGGSGVVSSVNDLLLWSRNFYSKQFGGQAFYDLMHRTERFAHERDNQALGLYLDEYKGRAFAAWDGGDFGVSSQVMRFTGSGTAIVVLSNLGSGEAFRKANAIADILIAAGYL